MSMDSWFPNPHDKDIAQLEEGLAYRAVKSGNNWILPSGKNAANGDPVVIDGTFGYATAAIVGGTDAIVEDTNWKPYGDGGALGKLLAKTHYYSVDFNKRSIAAHNDSYISLSDLAIPDTWHIINCYAVYTGGSGTAMIINNLFRKANGIYTSVGICNHFDSSLSIQGTLYIVAREP